MSWLLTRSMTAAGFWNSSGSYDIVEQDHGHLVSLRVNNNLSGGTCVLRTGGRVGLTSARMDVLEDFGSLICVEATLEWSGVASSP